MDYKIALVHDYLSQDGGAERVLRVFHEIWPNAPIFVLFHDREKEHLGFTKADVRSSFIEKLPFWQNHYQWYLPLMPRATESFDLQEYDVVLSSTSAYAKGILKGPNSIHICYCHTPTRYLWTESENYVKELPHSPLIKWALPPILSHLRTWDAVAARDRVDYFIANSSTVADRIARFYGRKSTIINPPIELSCTMPVTPVNERSYFLAGGRLVPYKRMDLVIEVCNRLGWPLKIFGSGREEEKLRAMAGPTVTFLGHVADSEKCALYAGAKAYINPQEEDFGMTMTEAMMQGTPVIAYRKGGATEIVQEGITGAFFKEQSWEALLDVLVHFNAAQFDPHRIAHEAQRYGKDIFKEKIRSFIEQKLTERQYADSHRRTTTA